MRQLAISALLLAGLAHAASKDGSCPGAVIDIFGGRLTIPCDFRLRPEFEKTIRFVRLDADPRRPYGNIYIGKASDLPTQEAREVSAAERGATIERSRAGRLSVEITRQTTQQLLSDSPVTYVSALIYDHQHYIRVTDSDPHLWQQLLKQCDACGR